MKLLKLTVTVFMMIVVGQSNVRAGEYVGYELAKLSTFKTLEDYQFRPLPKAESEPERFEQLEIPRVTFRDFGHTAGESKVLKFLSTEVYHRSGNLLVQPITAHSRFVVANIEGPVSYFDVYDVYGLPKERRILDYFGFDISKRQDQSLILCQKGVVWAPSRNITLVLQPKFKLVDESKSTQKGNIGPILAEGEFKLVWSF